MTIYSGFRTLLFDGAISEFLQATGAIIAGCSAATSLAKLLPVGPLTSVVHCRPQVQIRNVVDDVTLQCCGPRQLVSDQLPAAVEHILGFFRRAGASRALVEVQVLGQQRGAHACPRGSVVPSSFWKSRYCQEPGDRREPGDPSASRDHTGPLEEGCEIVETPD